jgi:crossover junction endodeoxyribonuclease RusA
MTVGPLSFVIPGIPGTKGRPRLGAHGNVYTPKKTTSFEHTVQTYARQAMAITGWRLTTDRCAMTLRVFWPNRRRKDLDNVAKVVMDSTNLLVVHDDSQFDELHVYGAVDAVRPRVEVVVTKIAE